MSLELTIPKLGMTMKEAKIVEWTRAEGQWVHRGEVVLVIETEKITYEVEAPGDGYLHILVSSGETLPVGACVAVLFEEREAYEQEAAVEAASKAPSYEQHPSVPEHPGEPPMGAREAVGKRRLRASPLARRIAREHGMDLERVKGTGPGGRILGDDVLRALEQLREAPQFPTAEAAPAQEEIVGEGVKAVIPIVGMRRQIFTHMHQSLQETAQMTLTCQADAHQLVMLRERLMHRYEGDDAHINYNDILVRIVARALRLHPEINASVEGDQIVQWEGIHIGVAMELEEGLIVPVVRDAERLSIVEIHQRLQDLFDRARQRKLLLDEIKGGTFTITNLGHLGIDAFTPILNRPQSGILGVGRISKRPLVISDTEDRVEIRPCMTLSLTVDHRIIDGAPAARFLQTVRSFIEEPVLLVD